MRLTFLEASDTATGSSFLVRPGHHERSGSLVDRLGWDVEVPGLDQTVDVLAPSRA